MRPCAEPSPPLPLACARSYPSYIVGSVPGTPVFSGRWIFRRRVRWTLPPFHTRHAACARNPFAQHPERLPAECRRPLRRRGNPCDGGSQLATYLHGFAGCSCDGCAGVRSFVGGPSHPRSGRRRGNFCFQARPRASIFSIIALLPWPPCVPYACATCALHVEKDTV
jgi:hypothetical protein